MSAVTPAGGGWRSHIITPDIVPPDPAPMEAKAKIYKARGEELQQASRELMSANMQRQYSAKSVGFEAAFQANLEYASMVARAGGWYSALSETYTSVAGVYRDVSAGHDNVMNSADREMESTPPVGHPAIAATHHAWARGLATSGVASAMAKMTRFHSEYGPTVVEFSSKIATAPQAPVMPPASPQKGDGIAVPASTRKVDDLDQGDGPDKSTDPTNTAKDAAAQSGAKSGAHTGLEGGAERSAADNAAAAAAPQTPITPMPGTREPVAPSTSGGLFREAGLGGIPGGGGMPGGGVGSGGGGLGGLGSSNPLSSLTSGLGQPGSAPAGLSSLANSAGVQNAAAQIGQSPAAAIAKSVASGAGGGGAPVAPVSPATTTGVSSAASTTGAAEAVPAAGASSVAPSSGLGAAGAHVPPAAAAASPSGAGVASAAGAAAPAMMVPPPGMGAPAAAAGSGGAPVVPASTSGAAGAAGGPGPGSGVVPGSGSTTMVPTPVATPSVGAGGRSESSELRMARTLAAQLRRDSDAVNYPIIEWAVGVFRSDSSVAPETVVMSNEGFGYIPRGVYLPRGVRLLSSDPLVHSGFENRWTGWSDPARVLAEYAALRQERGGGSLVAAAATNRVEPFRTAGVEYVLCPRDNTPVVLTPPALDAVHVDRFEIAFPDVSARVDRLLADRGRDLIEELVKPLSLEMMTRVSGATMPYPPELRAMWEQITGNGAVSPGDWQAFNDATNRQYFSAAAYRPGFKDVAPEDDPTSREVYEHHWLIARSMELLRSFQYRPVSVADMLYPIAVAFDGDFTQRVGPALRQIEMAA